MYAYFKPIWEHSPLAEPLPSTSISVCACACMHKNQISIQLLLGEKMWRIIKLKKLENENTVKVGQFLVKAIFKKVL